jgi:hypothetical protein
MRPTFCSGDMLVENVSLSLGPTLTFNDLPSSMKVEFNLTNARPWGLQEIMAKFNSGYLRTVDVQKTFYETGKVSAPDGVTMYNEPVGILPLNDIVYESAASSSGTSGTSGSSGTSGAGGTNNTNPTNGAGGSTGTSGASGSTGTSGTSGASGSNKAPAPTNPANVEKAVKGKKENKKEMNKNASDPALKK